MLVCGDAVEERSRMRSIDDIIDKLDTSSADRAPDESQSPTVVSSVQQSPDAGDEETSRATATSDGRPSADGNVVQTKMVYQREVPEDRRQTVGSGTFPLPVVYGNLRVDRPSSTSEATVTVTPDTEQLWKMFGTPLSHLCQRLLTDFVHPEAHERLKTETAEPRITEKMCVKTESTAKTQVSNNLRQNVEIQSVPPSVDVQPLSSSRVGIVQSNGRELHTEGQKPPLPTKPNLPTKPTISKKPLLSKETSAGAVRRSSSLSSAPCSSSSSSSMQQRQTRSTSSQQSSSTCADAPLTMTNSAPTSPTATVIQGDAKQQQPVTTCRSTSGATTAAQTRSADHAPPTKVSEKTKLAMTGSAAERRSPVRDRMKTTKSEEFLARIHRRSVSPVRTPRLVSRSARGRSVDLSVASDTSKTLGRRTLSKEWAVVTTTTHEEVTVVYRPPVTSSASEIVHVDAPTVASSTAVIIKGQGQDTVNNNAIDSSGGRLYKTAIDNIRLSVGGSSTTQLSATESGDGKTSRQVRSPSSESDRIHGGDSHESANSSCQLDDLISSLIEISVDVEGSQSLQPRSLRQGVVFTAHY